VAAAHTAEWNLPQAKLDEMRVLHNETAALHQRA
jgi:hypothetical protein